MSQSTVQPPPSAVEGLHNNKHMFNRHIQILSEIKKNWFKVVTYKSTSILMCQRGFFPIHVYVIATEPNHR